MTTLALLHKELTESLAESGKLNSTQYRVLLKTHELTGKARISEIAVALNIRPNVVSQAADVLESQRLIKRIPDPKDGRATALAITAAGKDRINKIDSALSQHFTVLWAATLNETEAAATRDTIEAMGSGIEGHAPGSIVTEIPSSYLATIAEAYRGVSETLEDAAHLSFSDARVLQRIQEAGGVARIIDLAAALILPPNTVTRAGNRLEARGWVRRVTEEANLQAVFLKATPEGLRSLDLIQSALDHYGQWRLWRQLTAEQRGISYEASRRLAETLGKRYAAEILRRKS